MFHSLLQSLTPPSLLPHLSHPCRTPLHLHPPAPGAKNWHKTEKNVKTLKEIQLASGPCPPRNHQCLCHHCSRKKVNDYQSKATSPDRNQVSSIRHPLAPGGALKEFVFLYSIQTATRSDRQKAQGTHYCCISKENPRSNSVCSRSVKQMHSLTRNTTET